MPQFRLPLSGDVTQAINPWTWMTQLIGNQFGININLGKSSEPALEQIILDDVGSYGRQLGQIGDAMRVLIRKTREPGHRLPRTKTRRSTACSISSSKSTTSKPATPSLKRARAETESPLARCSTIGRWYRPHCGAVEPY